MDGALLDLTRLIDPGTPRSKGGASLVAFGNHYVSKPAASRLAGLQDACAVSGTSLQVTGSLNGASVGVSCQRPSVWGMFVASPPLVVRYGE